MGQDRTHALSQSGQRKRRFTIVILNVRLALPTFDLSAGAALGVHLLVSLVGAVDRFSELPITNAGTPADNVNDDFAQRSHGNLRVGASYVSVQNSER
jgi:hypothetical protein